MSRPRRSAPLLLAAGAVPAVAALLAALDGQGRWGSGWLAYTVLLAVGAGLLYLVWRAVRGDRRVAVMAATALLIRLFAGAALTELLPRFGHETSTVHQAGYVFHDAYIRDRQAWDLAQKEQRLWTAFGGEYSGDQYGGMLALSAGIYRLLSPDAHRPLLILVVTAVASAAGVLFLWRAVHDSFGDTVGNLAGWILALYPEAVLLSSSQMREALMIPGIAMAFYGLTLPRSPARRRGLWVAGALAGLFVISPPIALVTLGLLFGFWLLEPHQRRSWRSAALFGGLLALMVLAVIAIFSQYPSLSRASPLRVLLEWLQYNFGFQSYLLERSSGWVQKLFEEAGARWQSLIVVVYGVARPVLPAELVVPGLWIMRVVGVLRAAGWYALAPLLIYGLVAVLRPGEQPRRGQLVWLFVSVWAWILISAISGGGDQWDNPRYRTTFISWAALLAAWAWVWARERGDVWLRRWLWVEVVFVLVFAEWYISRYYRVISRLNFWVMTGLILAAAVFILGGGWLRDRRQRPDIAG